MTDLAEAARLLSPVATERTLRTYRERGLLRLRARRPPEKFVLNTPYSDGKASGTFKTAWKSALIRAGVPHGRMHDLRHTAASTLLCKGVPDWLAAKYLGMSVETLRRTYGHLIPGALDGAAKAVGGK